MNADETRAISPKPPPSKMMDGVDSSSIPAASNSKNMRRNAKNLARRKKKRNNSGSGGGVDKEQGSTSSTHENHPLTAPPAVETKNEETSTISQYYHHGVPRGRRCIAEQSIKQKILAGGIDVGVVDIPKERINSLQGLPYKQTKNAIVVITTASDSDRAVAAIRNELLSTKDDGRRICIQRDTTNYFQFVGLDTETRPKFNKGGTEHPPALLQIATCTTAYLFRLTFAQLRKNEKQGEEDDSTTITESLIRFLSDTTIIKVGVGIHNDVKQLNRVYGHTTCGNGSSYLDLAPLVRLKWPAIRRTGLRNLTATLLGYKLCKAQQIKNWEMERLTPAMEAYAAADAFVALDLLAAIIGGVGVGVYDGTV